MKKLIYLLSAILVLIYFSRCGSEKVKEEAAEEYVENIIEKASGNKVKIDIDEKDGQAQMTIDGEEISIKSEGNKIPENFPPDVYLLKGKVESAGVIATGQGESFTVVILPEKSFKDVVSSLTKEMKSKGWVSTMNMNMSDEAMQMYTKGENNATITINGKDNEVEVAYMVTVVK